MKLNKYKIPTSILKSILLCIGIVQLISCDSTKQNDKPNIILIMADDMGYECLGAYGNIEYETPNLDKMAEEGLLFTNCYSQPLCTPSRVKIMTGKYNYRNYEYFGYLNTDARTIGHLMRDAGYATCIAGKWQLNGLSYQDSIEDWNDNTKPNKLGFDEYCLWQLTKARSKGERYADPLIEQNGELLDRDLNSYGPDIFSNFVLDFIERKKDDPFFVYYPMVLVHDPFVPTPESKIWSDVNSRYENDTSYFAEMVEYTDKIVGKIFSKLNELGLDNTLVLFTGDNGTSREIYSTTINGKIKGEKGKTVDAGIHVPLIAHWQSKIVGGKEYEGLIDFSDFYPTLAELTGNNVDLDGSSFYQLLTGDSYKEKDNIFMHYDPRWGKYVNSFRNQFVMNKNYKLYADGSFYDILKDKEEKYPLELNELSPSEKNIYQQFLKEFDKHPSLN